jgi:CBS domain-containing protein
MKLKDIYRPGAVTVHMGDDLASAARRMEQAQVGALAVVDEAGQLVGIFTERDLVRAIAWADNPARVLVSAYASSRPETADVEEDSRDVARRMLDLGSGTSRYRRRRAAGWDGLDARPAGRRSVDVGRLHGCGPENRSGALGTGGSGTVCFGVPAHPSRRA